MFDIKYLVTEDSERIQINDDTTLLKRLTIINKYFNTTTKKNEYKVNHVSGFYESNKGISIQDTSLIEGDGFFCVISLQAPGYQTPQEFQANPTGWTLKNDDYIVKGIVNEVTSINDVLANNECMKITKVAVCDYGSECMQHFEIWGQ